MITKSKSPLVIVALTIIFLFGCTSKNNMPETFGLTDINGVTISDLDLDSLPMVVGLNSDDQNITRKINVTEREKCYTSHPFGFETYSGEFTTANNEKLNRLSYPEIGDDLLFVVDEYGSLLNNGKCLIFSYSATVSKAITNGEYDKNIYSKELDIAAQIMSTLTIPQK